MKVILVSTGGTIASRPGTTGSLVPELDGQSLLERLELPGDLAVDVDEFANIPSDHFTGDLWLKLARRVSAQLEAPDVVGLVVTCGTDAMEDTAYFFDLVLTTPKPVVVTGAQRHAGAQDTDGTRNLQNALLVAASPASQRLGTLVVMDEEIHAAQDFLKVHTSRVHGFASANSGPIGHVVGLHVVYRATPLNRVAVPLPAALPRVDIVAVYPEADERLILASMDAGARGVVIQAMGIGNATPGICEGVRRAEQAGVVVLVTSRAPEGYVRPIYGFAGGGATLQEAGGIFAWDLSAAKARVLLQVALGNGLTGEDIRELLDSRLEPSRT